MDFMFLADRPDAIPIIARWYFDEWGHRIEGNSFERTCERIQEQLNRDKPPLRILAIEDDVVCGAAQLKIREMDIYPDKEYWLGSVYVSTEFRGNGIATRLTQKIEDIAIGLGIRKLHAQTERLDGGLYARIGWKPIDRVHYRGFDVVVLEKELR